MRQSERSQLAAPVVLIYWLMLLGGLALFSATRDDAIAAVPLWVGAIAGTLLGQYLALHNFRLWVTVLVIALAGLYCEPMLPLGDGTAALWRAFIPAALCGYWSLGDRAALAALWFPTVLWMLTILDRNGRELAPDGLAALLLGGVAVLFVAFLRARESRRIGLWRRVGPEPLAPIPPVELLREPPGRQLARAAWGLSVGAITIAITVWLAPPLWQTEILGGHPVALAAGASDGVPCCPVHRHAPLASARIKEYLDLGLGYDPHTGESRDELDCRICEAATDAIGPGVAVADPGGGFGGPVVPWGGGGAPPARARASWTDPGAATVPHPATASGGLAWTDNGSPIETTLSPPTATANGLAWTDRGSPTETTSSPHAGSPDRLAWTDDGLPIETTLSDPPARSAVPAPPAGPPAAPAPAPPAVAAAPPAPIAPSPSATAAMPAPLPPGAAAPSATPHRASPELAAPPILGWIAMAVVGAVVLQIVRLGLRPLRRLATLRHLRRPFWDETLDQRISNAWQLALVGLRDAGWRAGVTEAPGQLARRVGVDGLDRCAQILERARHGIGLDAGDLTDMQTSADVAYRAARTGTGRFARVLGWLRWPLT